MPVQSGDQRDRDVVEVLPRIHSWCFCLGTAMRDDPHKADWPNFPYNHHHHLWHSIYPLTQQTTIPTTSIMPLGPSSPLMMPQQYQQPTHCHRFQILPVLVLSISIIATILEWHAQGGSLYASAVPISTQIPILNSTFTTSLQFLGSQCGETNLQDSQLSPVWYRDYLMLPFYCSGDNSWDEFMSNISLSIVVNGSLGYQNGDHSSSSSTMVSESSGVPDAANEDNFSLYWQFSGARVRSLDEDSSSSCSARDWNTAADDGTAFQTEWIQLLPLESSTTHQWHFKTDALLGHFPSNDANQIGKYLFNVTLRFQLEAADLNRTTTMQLPKPLRFSNSTSHKPELQILSSDLSSVITTPASELKQSAFPVWLTIGNRDPHVASWLYYTLQEEYSTVISREEPTISSPNQYLFPSCDTDAKPNEIFSCSTSQYPYCLVSRLDYVIPVQRAGSVLTLRQLKMGEYWSDSIRLQVGSKDEEHHEDEHVKEYLNATFWSTLQSQYAKEVSSTAQDTPDLDESITFAAKNVPVSLWIGIALSFSCGVVLAVLQSRDVVGEFLKAYCGYAFMRLFPGMRSRYHELSEGLRDSEE